MPIMFKLFKLTSVTDTVAGRCASCAHFRNDPAFLERAVPGLTSMSSAHASVRCDDGVCVRHDRYLSARSSCAQHTPLAPADATNCRILVPQ